MTNNEAGPASSADPRDVAQRMARATKESLLDPYAPLPPGASQDIFFGLADDGTAGTALLVATRSATKMVMQNGKKVPEWTKGISRPMGHYDPAMESWMFYPEYVAPCERPVLAVGFEQLAQNFHDKLTLGDVEGRSVLNPYDPLTVHARQQMARVFGETDLVRRLIEDDPVDYQGNGRRTDDYTTATFMLTSRISGPGVGGQKYVNESERHDPNQYGILREQILSVAYQGLLSFKNNGAVTRQNQYVHVAARSEDDESVWLPSLDVIGIEEWDRIASVPQTLLNYKYSNASFSTEHCAVMY